MVTIHRQICKRINTASGEGLAIFSSVSFDPGICHCNRVIIWVREPVNTYLKDILGTMKNCLTRLDMLFYPIAIVILAHYPEARFGWDQGWGQLQSWSWNWSWNLRSWSWSWYSKDLSELELELKLPELELELELKFSGVGVGIGVEILSSYFLLFMNYLKHMTENWVHHIIPNNKTVLQALCSFWSS